MSVIRLIEREFLLNSVESDDVLTCAGQDVDVQKAASEIASFWLTRVGEQLSPEPRERTIYRSHYS